MWSWIKSLFCSHRWDVRVQVVARPRRDVERMRGTDADVLLRVLQGTTSVILTCERCGTLRSDRLLGVPKNYESEVS